MIGAAFHDRRLRAVAFVLVLLKLWLVTAQPTVVIAGAWHDDRLFVAMADRILHGEWLGAYDQMTLAKGAGYPLFIAATFCLGIPLPLAEHLLYLVACWLVVRALRPVLRHDGWALLLFAALVWQPMSYLMPEPWSGTVVRQNLYTPLALLVFAGLISFYTRRTASLVRRAGWALLLGLAAGGFWLTREEGLWIVPSAVLLVIVAMVLAWRGVLAGLASTWLLLVAGVALTASVGTVAAINARHYGWFGECEFHAPQFAAAYGALARIRVGEPKLRFPVTRAMREAAYPHSPALAELQPRIEHDMTIRWAGAEDREINGGMWMWALRDAVKESGHAPNAAAALAFYQRIADEVNAACDAGKIPAGPRRASFLPPWNPGYTAEAKASIGPMARHFLLWDGFRARPPASQSHGDASLMLLFRDMTQWRLSPSADAPDWDTPRSKAWRAWRIGALQTIGENLRWIVVGAGAIGLIAWIWTLGGCLLGRRWPEYLWWVATAVLGGVVAVFAIAFLVHVTSWPDMRPLRFAQAYPLYVLFAVTAIIGVLPAARPAREAANAE